MSHLRISVQSGIGCRSLSWVLRNSLLAVVQLVFGRRHFDALAGTAAFSIYSTVLDIVLLKLILPRFFLNQCTMPLQLFERARKMAPCIVFIDETRKLPAFALALAFLLFSIIFY